MNGFIHGMVRAAAESFTLPGPVLEVGSFVVEGQEQWSLRPLFPSHEYLGIDIRPGPGVDRVENVEKLTLPDRSVGVVLALNAFEHVRKFWLGLAEVRRVLRPDGVLLFSTPFYFKVHHYPNDYWRFTPEGVKVLLEDYPFKLVGVQGSDRRPSNVWAVAFAGGRPAVTEAQIEAFGKRLKSHAKPESSPGRRLVAKVGSKMLGKAPFETILYETRAKFEAVDESIEGAGNEEKERIA